MTEFRGNTLAQAVHLATHQYAHSSRLEHKLLFKKIDKQSRRFPFIERVKAGNTLCVGEGNFSFALSIAKRAKPKQSQFCATSLEPMSLMSHQTKKNIRALEQLGGQIKTGIDATRLSQYFSGKKFDLIVFQFPNIASRIPIYGQSANHWLVTRFLRNAAHHLLAKGEIAITTVDNPHYEGVFKMKEAARKAQYNTPEIFNFNPTDFAQYRHENTLGGVSALERQQSFATFVFRR